MKTFKLKQVWDTQPVYDIHAALLAQGKHSCAEWVYRFRMEGMERCGAEIVPHTEEGVS